jgi:hypothetical protein
MGWIKNFIDTIKGKQPTDWTFIEGIPVAGSPIEGQPIEQDRCYVELYVDSLKLGRVRKFATTFNGVVYAFAHTARQGDVPSKLSAVTQPQEIMNVGEADLNNVITFSKRMFKVIPWRGDPLDLELGLFSVKTGNIASDIADYVVRLSNTIAPGITSTFDPLLPLVTEGLDMMAGQTDEVELELAVDTSLQLSVGKHYALIRKPRQEIDKAKLSVADGGRLLHDGRDIDASFCVFSIRPRRDNPEWGNIEDLRKRFDELKAAILAGKQSDAEDAMAAFRRAVIVCPDLIMEDKKKVIRLATDQMELAFAGGAISATRGGAGSLRDMSLGDLPLYSGGTS